MDYDIGIQQVGKELRRAPRYSIVAPVRFRSGRGEWLDATTVNIGSLGVLVRTGFPQLLTAPLEMRIDLSHNHTFVGSVVVCRGRVVRTEPSASGEVLMAVTIDEFQFQPAIDMTDRKAERTTGDS
jgi:hypothetical protein